MDDNNNENKNIVIRFIDRVDLMPGTNNEVELIDYKTGKSEPGPDARSKQLLLYYIILV
ncbi:MAG: PD-(D/E)XK nuclease family protein [Candidatus Methanoperedens sp.]